MENSSRNIKTFRELVCGDSVYRIHINWERVFDDRKLVCDVERYTVVEEPESREHYGSEFRYVHCRDDKDGDHTVVVSDMDEALDETMSIYSSSVIHTTDDSVINDAVRYFFNKEIERLEYIIKTDEDEITQLKTSVRLCNDIISGLDGTKQT